MHSTTRTLADIVKNIDMVRSNTIMDAVYDWELYNGDDRYITDKETGDELSDLAVDVYDKGLYEGDVEISYRDYYEYYIIAGSDADILVRHTDETIWYSPSLEMYVWGIDTFGTPWQGVKRSWWEMDDRDFEEQIEWQEGDEAFILGVGRVTIISLRTLGRVTVRIEEGSLEGEYIEAQRMVLSPDAIASHKE